MMQIHRVLACLLLCELTTVVAGKQCLGRDQWSCVFDNDQSVIALHSVANRDLTPRWKDLTASDGNTYSYNPCFPFDEGNCTQAAACKKTSMGTENIGDTQTATFAYVNNQLLLGYTSGSGILIETTVLLVCDPHGCAPTLTTGGKQGPGSYQFTLTSACACPNGCNETGPINCLPAAAPSVHTSTIISIGLSVVISYWFGYKL